MLHRKRYIYSILFFFIAGLFLTIEPCAQTAKEQYFKAEACYRELRQNPKDMQYRDNWLRCIDQFQAVYQQDPTGPWAAAGLYKSGRLYQELAKYSGRESDAKEALDIFERIIKRFPDSRYRSRAADAIRTFSTNSSSQNPPTTPVKAKETYLDAEACYRELRQDPQKMKYRHYWLGCIDKFQAVYHQDPTGPWAAAGLFMSGQLYEELAKYSGNQSHNQAALAVYRQVISEFPDSRYRVKAKLAIAALAPSDMGSATQPDDIGEQIQMAEAQAEKQVSSTDSYPPVAEQSKPSDGETVIVKDLRYWSNPSYTRIVIDADRETSYAHHLLKKDPSINKPQRLYVDLANSRLGESIKKTIPINDALLINARAGQYTKDSVRVVVDIKSFETYKIFSLRDPFRIVVDVRGSAVAKASPTQLPAVTPPEDTKIPPGALAKQLALGVRRIVVDPGHGGKDYGAPGYLKGVHEKNVTLALARRLVKKIREELKCEVIMTRNSDRFLTLEERTAFANTKDADLFVSIHTNSSRDRRAYGIETYFLNLATDDEAIRVAARENATSTKNISDLQAILNDLMQNAKINESSRLASYVQSALVKKLKRRGYRRIKDKGVKQAPFYVLLGAEMPAILIETSFISNPRECNRLINRTYQDRLCEGIVEGIKQYIRETNPYAFFGTGPQTKPQG